MPFTKIPSSNTNLGEHPSNQIILVSLEGPPRIDILKTIFFNFEKHVFIFVWRHQADMFSDENFFEKFKFVFLLFGCKKFIAKKLQNKYTKTICF
jgi:hypothetical protein